MAKAGVVVPAIIAALIICALILLTCAYFSNPGLFIRIGRPSDEESIMTESEKVVVVNQPPSGITSRLLGNFGFSGSVGHGGGTPAADVVTANPNEDVQIIEPTPDGVNVVDAVPEAISARQNLRSTGNSGWFR